MDKLIPVYIVNLKERPDRLDHARGQFKDKNEFEVRIVNAIKHDIGAIGHLMVLICLEIIKIAQKSREFKFSVKVRGLFN